MINVGILGAGNIGETHARAARETEGAASARSTTWRIIGRPCMSRSGFPGRRLEEKRAGMIATTVGLSLGEPV